MDNHEIARLLTETADLMEIAGEDGFRIRSYRNAASVIDGYPEPISAIVREPNDAERLIAAFAVEPHGGLIFPPDGSVGGHLQEIIDLADRYRLPAIYPQPGAAARGGLMYYGSDNVDIYRRAAFYVDRILRGEKPGDLPVQAPIKYEFAINLKTAKGLGLTIPETLLATADEVIQ